MFDSPVADTTDPTDPTDAPKPHTITDMHPGAIEQAAASRHRPMWVPTPGPGAAEYVAGWICGDCDAQLGKAVSYPCEQAILWESLRELSAQLAAARRTEAETKAALVHAANVMMMLDVLGPGIAGHLIDTDDNEGQRLRECLDDLGIEASPAERESAGRAASLLAQPEPAEDENPPKPPEPRRTTLNDGTIMEYVGRLESCVEQWPECADGEYNPSCCRFPKSCSCSEYRYLPPAGAVVPETQQP